MVLLWVKAVKMNLNWKKRAIFVFGGAIMILSLFLTLTALREAEREKLSREREIDREQQRYATLLTGEIDSLFSGIEEKITAVVSDARTQLCQPLGWG